MYIIQEGNRWVVQVKALRDYSSRLSVQNGGEYRVYKSKATLEEGWDYTLYDLIDGQLVKAQTQPITCMNQFLLAE
jgi:hypothetical protein